MGTISKFFFSCFVILSISLSSSSQADSILKIFQFPADQIPRIDGNTDDWQMVPEEYLVGSDLLTDDTKHFPMLDTNNLNVRVRVGWVKGMNHLYFLYEAYDNY